MMHGHGLSPHHAGHHMHSAHHMHGAHRMHGAHHVHGAHHMHDHMHGAHHMHVAHHGHPVHPRPLHDRSFRSRGYQPIAVVVGLQYTEQHRPMLKCRLILGIVFLTVSAVLLFCGILNFLGVIECEHFMLGVPMLAFGGVIFFAGLMFTIMACQHLRQLDQNQAADENAGTPPQPCNAEISHSPWNSEFNQPPSSAPYGQPPSSAPCGQPPSNDPYGQPANRAQSNWSSPSQPLPASPPPPYSYI